MLRVITVTTALHCALGDEIERFSSGRDLLSSLSSVPVSSSSCLMSTLDFLPVGRTGPWFVLVEQEGEDDKM